MKANEGSSAEAAIFSPRGIEPRREMSRSLGSKDNGKMEIMIFSIKLDKFTGFFDKFLKIYYLLTDFYSKSYHLNMSAAHSDSATKKVFRLPRICPQLPAFAHREGERVFRVVHRGAGAPSGRLNAI